MSRLFSSLKKLPLARGNEPGTVSPAAWNRLVDYCAALEKRVAAMVPQSSPDVLVSQNSSGFSLKLARRGGGGGGGGSPLPWQPVFITEAEVLKVSFRLGTANNVVPTNWNTKFTAPTGDTVKFVVLAVTTSGGKVTSCALSLDSSAPATDEISKDTPPTSHKVVLGAVGSGTSQMLVTKNILLAASVVFTETAAASADRAEPFHRWYRWDATDAAT
jgi:hypothetical protein